MTRAHQRAPLDVHRAAEMGAEGREGGETGTLQRENVDWSGGIRRLHLDVSSGYRERRKLLERETQEASHRLETRHRNAGTARQAQRSEHGRRPLQERPTI